MHEMTNGVRLLAILEHFLNTKAKALIVFLFSGVSLVLSAISTHIATLLFSGWYGLVAGVALMVLAIPFHMAGKKLNAIYLVSFFLNSVANGCSVSAYYIQTKTATNPFDLIIAAIPAVSILFLAYVTLQLCAKTKRFSLTFVSALTLILMIIAVVFWIKTGFLFFSFGFFSLLISLFYLGVFGVTVNHDERPVLRDVSYGSYGSFIILTVIVIAILSEGEVLSGVDFGGEGNSKKKRSS